MKANLLTKIKNYLCIFLQVMTFIYLAVIWDSLPDKIPMKYNAIGEVSSWGSANSILFLPILMVVLYGFLTVIEKLPNTWNTMYKITDENREFMLETTLSMLVTIKLILVATFAYLTYNIASLSENMGMGFVALSILSPIATIIYYLVKQSMHQKASSNQKI